MRKTIDEQAVRAAARREWASSQETRDEFGSLQVFEAFSVAHAKGLAKVVSGRVHKVKLRSK